MQKPGPIISGVMLIVLLALPQLIGYLGASMTFISVESWYPTLNKPPLTPPSWTFGVAWTTLYLLMGLASWLVWRSAGGIFRALPAFAIYFAQLGLNLAWSYFFFGRQEPLAGLIDIALLAAAILLTIILFWRVNRVAGALMLPYLAWVLFATYLNAGFVVLNG